MAVFIALVIWVLAFAYVMDDDDRMFVIAMCAFVIGLTILFPVLRFVLFWL